MISVEKEIYKGRESGLKAILGVIPWRERYKIWDLDRDNIVDIVRFALSDEINYEIYNNGIYSKKWGEGTWDKC